MTPDAIHTAHKNGWGDFLNRTGKNFTRSDFDEPVHLMIDEILDALHPTHRVANLARQAEIAEGKIEGVIRLKKNLPGTGKSIVGILPHPGILRSLTWK